MLERLAGEVDAADGEKRDRPHPGLLATLASGDAEAADRALQQLWTDLHHQGGTIAVGALAVPLSLILAIAQLAREHHHGHAPQWAQDLWSDPGRPPEVRIGAGLAWLCLATAPAPDELRALLTDPGTRQYDDLLEPVPWLTWVDHNGSGLRTCIDEMLTTTVPETVLDDPWGGEPSS